MAKLKLYVDRLSQPSRAILIFCQINGIEFEEVVIQIAKGQHRSPEFKEINPMGQVPAIVDGSFKLFERYPADLYKRASIESVLDWHHSNLRRGAAPYLLHTVLAPILGLPANPQAAVDAEKILSSSLPIIDTFWLEDGGKFLLGNSEPSIADLSLVCEIMQLELVSENNRNRILGPHKKVLRWVEDVKEATQPHFDEIHSLLYNVKSRLGSSQPTV